MGDEAGKYTDHDRFAVVMPRQSGKSGKTTNRIVAPQGVVASAKGSVTIAGMTFSEQEFRAKARALGDQDLAVTYFAKIVHEMRDLFLYFEDIRRRGTTPRFNPRIPAAGYAPGMMPSDTDLYRRVLALPTKEGRVVALLAQRMRDAYEPHHKGAPMQPWDDVPAEARAKWFEMAMLCIRELSKLGLLIDRA